MKLSDAVRHLESLGLAVVMPDGNLCRTSKKLRKPRGLVPIRVVKNGAMSKKLLDMIRRSRAEYSNSRSSRNAK